VKELSLYWVIQEDSIEFQLQSVYLIYTWLMVYAILNLAYSKEYIYYILLIYSMYDIIILDLSMMFYTCDRYVTPYHIVVMRRFGHGQFLFSFSFIF